MKLKCLVGLHDHHWSLIRLDRDSGRFFVECKHCNHRKWLKEGIGFQRLWKEFDVTTSDNHKLRGDTYMNTIFNGVFGSHLYGLNTPTSDKDYKGVFMIELIEVTI